MKKANYQIEVVDGSNRPLSTMDIKEVHRQALSHRSVIVLIYDTEGKLYLQKRSSNKKLYSGRWDISASGHVHVGESSFDAAVRELESELNIRSGNLRQVSEIKASAETGNEFITLFTLDKINNIPNPNHEEVESGYFYSEEELEWLVREYRELLAPALVFLHDQQFLFKIK